MYQKYELAFVPTHGAPRTAIRRLVTCTCGNSQDSRQMSRRRATQLLISISTATLLPSASPPEAATASAKLENLTAPIVMCRRVMGPVNRYIEEGSWDKGRTNVNYCTRVLAMRKNMRDAAELLEGDGYYDALDIMGDMLNIMTQLDASLYTPLFIPADEGISVEQTKYQKQARGFYEEALQGLDKFLSIVPSDVLDKATQIADKTKYEIPIERD